VSCDVCLYGADDVDNEFYSETMLAARKPHRCCECGQPISPGAMYQRATGKADGAMFSYKTCGICAEVRGVFHCGGAFYFRTLWGEMEEQAFEYLTTASECFRELSPTAKAVVLERWTTWKGLAGGPRGETEETR
jgi:hypothetical protein